MIARLAALLVVLAAAVFTPAPARASALLRCESVEYQYAYCPAQTQRGVRLARQVSDSGCEIGQTWGYDRGGIWVTNGCAAEFEIGTHGQGYGWGYGYNQGGYVHCESHDYAREYCRVNTGGAVRLLNQTSHSACIEGQTWGYDHGGIWTVQGCGGEFQVGGGGSAHHDEGGYRDDDHDGGAYREAPAYHENYGGAGHGNRETLRCESVDNTRNFCDARNNRHIRLLRQFSESSCVEGRSWYATDRGVFVDHGCRADFEVTY